MEDNTFSITPMSQTVNLNPGGTFKGSIKIVNYNNSRDDLNYKVTVSPYGVIGEDYQADLQTVTNHNEIVNWITIEEPTGTIKPNETKEVHYTIKAPENATSGGQYATIAVSSNPEKETKEMVVNVFELASVIYAQIGGENKKEGSVTQNSVPAFSFSPDVEVSAVIENTGNVHDYANVVINVKNFFSGDIIYESDSENGNFSEVIMPETTRKITRKINNLPALGVVHINQTITYNGETSVVEKNLIICPIWFLILVACLIVTLITVITLKIRRAKNRKEAI